MPPRDTPRVTGIVLAGGRSRRMGSDKAALLFGGRPLLQRTVAALAEVADEVVVVLAPGRKLPPLECPRPVRVAADPVEGEGPLVGIAAGLRAASAPVALVVAVDMPFLRPALLRLLAERAAAGSRCVVPIYEGRPQPLCSAWRREALEVVEAQVETGERAVMSVARTLDAERLLPAAWRAADPDGRSFVNVNTPEEFEAAQARADEWISPADW